MTVISGTTKLGQRLRARASRYEGTELEDVYGRYSSVKASAMRNCKEWCEQDNGYNFHIISHNTSTFSVAWNYVDQNTGEIMTRIETANHSYIVDSTRRIDNEKN